MKAYGVALAVLLGMVGLTLSNQGWSQAIESVQEHLSLARSYQELAEAGRQETADLRREKEEYARIAGPFPSRSNTPWVKVKDREYDALIAENEALVSDLEKFSEWHRLQAEELKSRKFLGSENERD